METDVAKKEPEMQFEGAMFLKNGKRDDKFSFDVWQDKLRSNLDGKASACPCGPPAHPKAHTNKVDI